MNQTCVITLTPVGNQIQEVQNCTIATSGSQVSSTLLSPSSSVSRLFPCLSFIDDFMAGGNSRTNRFCYQVSASSSTSVTATAQAAFSIPGRSMQVLPVGISVFGSITAITIIIVVLVTLERVRYRKVGSPYAMRSAAIY